MSFGNHPKLCLCLTIMHIALFLRFGFLKKLMDEWNQVCSISPIYIYTKKNPCSYLQSLHKHHVKTCEQLIFPEIALIFPGVDNTCYCI